MLVRAVGVVVGCGVGGVVGVVGLPTLMYSQQSQNILALAL